MGDYAWLKDDDEFPSLTLEKGWDDCGLDDNNEFLDTKDDDGWQIISPHNTTTTKPTFADIVKRVARTNGPFHKRHITTFPAEPKNTNQACSSNKVIDDEDGAIDPSEPYLLRKSKARRRYLNDTWIFQHRVTVLTRLGYGSSIQGDDVFQYHEIDGPRPILLEEIPVDRLEFIHFWRYICKEDPEPEVDRLRKSWVKTLTMLTT